MFYKPIPHLTPLQGCKRFNGQPRAVGRNHGWVSPQTTAGCRPPAQQPDAGHSALDRGSRAGLVFGRRLTESIRRSRWRNPSMVPPYGHWRPLIPYPSPRAVHPAVRFLPAAFASYNAASAASKSSNTLPESLGVTVQKPKLSEGNDHGSKVP